jgi:hypothetical protein
MYMGIIRPYASHGQHVNDGMSVHNMIRDVFMLVSLCPCHASVKEIGFLARG